MPEEIKKIKIKDITISTLDGMLLELSLERRAGNSTKLIDRAIQILFNGYTVFVQDHWVKSGPEAHEAASLDLFQKVLKRLASEHNLDFLIKRELIQINKRALTIKLVSPKKKIE